MCECVCACMQCACMFVYMCVCMHAYVHITKSVSTTLYLYCCIHISVQAERQIYLLKRPSTTYICDHVLSHYTAPNTQISGAVYIKGGSKSNTFEYTTAIYTTLFSLAITLYQQPAFHFFPTLLLFLSYSVSYLSNPRSTHLYSDPYSIPG